MPAALIRIDQPTHPTTPTGQPGVARRDLVLGDPVIFRNTDDTDVVRWLWIMVDRPLGSTATLSAVNSPSVTFTPDVEGSYLVSLAINDGVTTGENDLRIGAVESAFSLRKPATGETASSANFPAPVIPGKGWGKDMEGWLDTIGAGVQDLANVLTVGNTTGGTNIELTTGDDLVGQGGGVITFDGAGEIALTPTTTATCTGDFVVTGKLTVGGLIDPTGLVMDEQAVVPFVTTPGKATWWVQNTVPNKPKFTNDVGTDFDVALVGTVTLAQVLAAGNMTGGTNIEITNLDAIVGEDGGSISFVAGTGDVAIQTGGTEVAITAATTRVSNDLTVGGKLTVSGLIDPTGLVMDEQAANPFTSVAGKGTYWVLNTAPPIPVFTDDDDDDHHLLLTAYQNIAVFQNENVTNGLASTTYTIGGAGFPTASSQIVASDFVDFTGANVGNPPTVNGYTFGSIPGDATLISLNTLTSDLNTTGSTVGDMWAHMIKTTAAGTIILGRVVLV